MTGPRLTVGIEDTVTSARPDGWRSLADLQIGRHVFETLVRESSGHAITPAVARSWTVARRGTEWTFEIRRDRAFHDGSPFSSAVVAACLRDQILETVGLDRYVIDLGTRGDDRVVLRTAVPVASMLYRLATPKACVVSPGGGGSGPYRHAGSGDGRMVLKRADRDPQADGYSQITFRRLTDGREMWQSVVSGLADVIYECPYDRVPRGRPRNLVDGVVIHSVPSRSVNMLVFQTAGGPTRSLRLRRCIEAAIDREQMLDIVHLGVGEVPRGPIASDSPYFTPGYPLSESAESAESAPKGTRIRVLATRGYYPGALEFLRRQLAARSVQCDVELLDFAQLVTRLRAGDFEAVLTGTNTGSDPDLFLTEFFHSNGRCNFGRLRDAALDGCIDRARETFDIDLRRELYQRAVDRIRHLVPVVFLRRGPSVVAHRPNVAGLLPRDDHLLYLEAAFPSSRPGESGCADGGSPLAEPPRKDQANVRTDEWAHLVPQGVCPGPRQSHPADVPGTR